MEETGMLIASGLDTAGQTTFDALERGVDTERALTLGTAAGAIEAITEKLPLDNLFKIAKAGGKENLKTVLTAIAKHSGIGAGEELLSNLSSTLSDMAIMRDKSDYQQYISKLCEEKMITREEAEKEALIKFFVKEPIVAAAQGAISDAIMGSGANLYSRFADANRMNTEMWAVSGNPLYKAEIVSTRFLNSSELLYKNAKNIPTISDYEDIVIHGDKTGFSYKDKDGNEFFYTVREFADILKNSPVYLGKNIRLISCESGAEGATSAQSLANLLKVNVLAPTDVVWVLPNGKMVVGPTEFENTGSWKVFKPKGEQL